MENTVSNIFIISGYFIHGFTVGHIAMVQDICSRMHSDDKLVVIINNEKQQALKYISARTNVHTISKQIRSYLRSFTHKHQCSIVKSIDTDRTVKNTLRKIAGKYCRYDNIYFCNDGDCKASCPEEQCIQLLYLGNPKISSSGESKR
jgi:hypothetical protein